MTDYVICYQTVDSRMECERWYNSLAEAQEFVKNNLDETLLDWVEMYVPNMNICEEEPYDFFIISGYTEILEYGR